MAAISREELFSLLQNQAELTGLLRDPIKNEKDLLKAKDDLSDHNNFINQIGRISTRLQLPLEITFQCLMHMSTSRFDHAGASSSNGNPADFDRHHRHGNVPMHQAKVLKREGLSEIQPKIEAAIPGDKLEEMIRFSSSLRSLLRMKVEDGNDLSMARRAISYADDYMQRIFRFANGNVDLMWKMFNAVDDRELGSLIANGSSGSSDRNEDSALGSSTSSAGTMASTFGALGGTMPSLQATIAPLPPIQQFSSAVDSLCKKSLVSSSTVVSERQQALATIETWFRQLSVVSPDDVDDDYDEEDDLELEDEDDEYEDDFENSQDSAIMSRKEKRNNNKSCHKSQQQQQKPKLTVDIIRAIFASPHFRKAIALHAGEKRSALCRSACDSLSTLLQNVKHFKMMMTNMSEMKESLLAWLDVLLKQVHVTVAAIASATDSCVRDMFVATGGYLSLMNMTAQVATSASQLELQRKTMGYLSLGVIAHLHTFDVSEVDPAAKCAVVAMAAGKLLKSSSEAVRRAARVGGTICMRVTNGSIPIQNWDERVDRAAAADAHLVASAGEAGTLQFECGALKYPEPCSVSKTSCGDGDSMCSISLTAGFNSNHHHPPSSAGSSAASSTKSSSTTTTKALVNSGNSVNNNNGSHHRSIATAGATTKPLSASSLTSGKPSGGGANLLSVSSQQSTGSVSTSSSSSNSLPPSSSAIKRPTTYTTTTTGSSSTLSRIPLNTNNTTTASTTVHHKAVHSNSNVVDPRQQQQHQQGVRARPVNSSHSASSSATPLSLSAFQQQQHQQPSFVSTSQLQQQQQQQQQQSLMMRSREPASPSTEATANRGIVPTNSAVPASSSTGLSDTLRRKIHTSSSSQQRQ